MPWTSKPESRSTISYVCRYIYMCMYKLINLNETMPKLVIAQNIQHDILSYPSFV